jgi:ligand-binding sensor domain-containing protein
MISTLLLFWSGSTVGQVKSQGIPFVRNFSSNDYSFHPKNFSILQDQKGLMYVGNSYGLLEFDGIHWNKLTLPDSKSALSLTIDSRGTIFIGSTGELGYLKADSIGRFHYQSLLPMIQPVQQNFSEVYRCFVVKDQVIFSSPEKIFMLQNGQMQILSPSQPTAAFDFAGEANRVVYCREQGKGLLKVLNGKLELIKGGEYFANHSISALLPFDADRLLVVSAEGLFLYNGTSFQSWPSRIDEFVHRNEITTGVALPNHCFAIGTVRNGILIFDHTGKPLLHLNKRNSLPSNYIYDLYTDKHANLWVASDNGLSCIEISSSFTAINEQFNLQGMGYASFIYKNKIYLGTSQGLFVKDWLPYTNPLEPTNAFKLVKNTEGQVWYINEVNGVLLCSHVKGLFVVENEVARQISPTTADDGKWIMKPFRQKSLLLVGTYAGLELYTYTKAGWVFRNRIKGFTESSRSMEVEADSTIWVCHGNKGLYRIKLTASLDSVSEVKNYSLLGGFQPDYFNDVATIKNEIVFAGYSQLYKYDPQKDRLVKHEQLNAILDTNVVINKISEQNDGNLWLTNEGKVEVIEQKYNGSFTVDKGTFQKLRGKLIGSYEYVWRYDAANIFVGTMDGFIHVDPTVAPHSGSFHTVIRKVAYIANRDSILFGGAFISPSPGNPNLSVSLTAPSEISYKNNAIRITYAALFYESAEKNQYQYYLEDNRHPADTAWSAWTPVSQKEYTNLPEGTYIFHVRSRNTYDRVSPEATYRFTIAPPWYRTQWAYIVYALSLTSFIFLLVKLILLKINKEKKRLSLEKKQEMLLMEKLYLEETLKAEKEIILLKNQKLEDEVKYKNNELAGLATNLSQKTAFLSQLKKDLLALSKNDEYGQNASLKKLVKTIDEGIEFNDSWNQFQTSFDLAHHNFLQKLRDKFPSLKPESLLICAYIKMNKSNKEIASLLNISVSAVEKRRFRLREKLNLDSDTKLTEVLVNI